MGELLNLLLGKTYSAIIKRYSQLTMESILKSPKYYGTVVKVKDDDDDAFLLYVVTFESKKTRTYEIFRIQSCVCLQYAQRTFENDFRKGYGKLTKQSLIGPQITGFFDVSLSSVDCRSDF